MCYIIKRKNWREKEDEVCGTDKTLDELMQGSKCGALPNWRRDAASKTGDMPPARSK